MICTSLRRGTSFAPIILLACAMTAALPSPSSALVQLYEDFSTDPGWDQRNNHLVTSLARIVTQNFGYRTSNHAGAAVGEIGGIVDRAPLQGAYYGQVLPTPLTLEQPLSFGGNFSLLRATHTVGFTSSSDIFVGFFNSQEQRWRPRNFLGFRVAGNNEPVQNVASIELSYGTSAWTADGAQGLPTLAPDGAKHNFQVTYNPNVGYGQMVFTWDGGAPQTLDIRSPHRAQGATFNRWGIFSNQLPGLLAGNQMEAYFDDVMINGAVHNFAANPNWEGVGNQTAFSDPHFYGRNDFGYRTTNRAGGSPGELGGLLWRVEDTDEDFQGYYADNVGSLSMNDRLRASGKVTADRFSIDSGVMLGWFNSADQDWPPSNFVGVYMDSYTPDGRYFTPMYGTQTGMTKFGREPWLLLRPDGVPVDWTIDYDPQAAGGLGAMTVTLDGITKIMTLDAGARAAGAVFDRFGVFNMQDANGKHALIYFDNISYTSGIPEPHSAWLVGLAATVMPLLRRRPGATPRTQA